MEPREQARRLYAEGKSLKDIAAELGVKAATVRSWKSRDGWDKKPADVATLQRNATRQAQRRRRAQVNRKAVESIEENSDLDEADRDFCAAFMSAPNPSQAAMKTGRYSTYNSARQQAFRMMRKPAVRAEIERLKEIKRMTMFADGDDLIEFLQRAIYSDMTAFADFKGGMVRLKSAAEVDGLVITEVSESQHGLKIKRIDPLKAAELLYKITGEFPLDKHRMDYDNKRLELEQRRLERETSDGDVRVVLDIERGGDNADD